MIELLEPIVGAPVTLEELKHKPGRRTTLRARGARRSAIVKVYASKRAPTVAARLAALAAGPHEVEVPKVLLCDPERHLVVLSEVPGTPLREPLLGGDGQTCERAGAAIGAWHRFWAGASPGALVPHTLERELEILEARIESASARIASLVRAALPSMTGELWLPATVVHRDLYEEQIMVGDRVGLIDLDDCALGPPELDVGNVCGHIRLLEGRSGKDLRPMSAWFLRGYRSAGPALDPALLDRCILLTLLRLSCIHGDPSLFERVGAAR